MVVKSNIKLIKSLQQKKYRIQYRLFVVEGKKSVLELLHSDLQLKELYFTKSVESEFDSSVGELVSEKELAQMSSLKTPSGVLAVFYMPQAREVDLTNWVLALDDVRDPGNLGTIIRLCDWFGIKHLFCSNETVDCYNPKTLQATMGSISRVNIVYGDLKSFITSSNIQVFGAFMEGESVYQVALPSKGILLMGNEANGIHSDVEKLVSTKLSIPSFGDSKTESLNVAMATGILLNEIRRS